MFEFDSKAATKDDDVYHFVSYLPIDGRLYELDGIREGPVDLGPIPAEKDWLDVVRPVIEKRMKKYVLLFKKCFHDLCKIFEALIIIFSFFLRYSEGEINFNLMAIVSDRKTKYEKKMQKIEKQMEVKK